jgi:hypothetical protein
MLYGRPPRHTIIPIMGINLYRMRVFQMSNEDLRREIGHTAYPQVVGRELDYRCLEDLNSLAVLSPL